MPVASRTTITFPFIILGPCHEIKFLVLNRKAITMKINNELKISVQTRSYLQIKYESLAQFTSASY